MFYYHHILAHFLFLIHPYIPRMRRSTPDLDLSQLRYLVVDEADRMMANIAHNWLELLESRVYSRGRDRPGPLNVITALKMELPLQKLLFSATLSQDPEKLEQLNLFEPKLFRSVVSPKDIRAEKVRKSAEWRYYFSIIIFIVSD